MSEKFESTGDHIPEPPPYRPPSEADSLLIRVTRGRSWNRCTFCGMYKEIRFFPRPLDEILRDLAVLARENGEVFSVFLGDADSLLHRHIVEIVEAVKQAFPACDRLTSYSRLTTLRRYKPDRLRQLGDAGLSRIHAGLESGSAAVLASLNKGHTPEQAIQGGRAAIEAGFELCLYQLVGVAGEEASQDHAIASAQVLSEIHSHHLRLRSYVPLVGTALGDSHHSGVVKPIPPLIRLKEIRTLLARIEPRDQQRSLLVSSDHFSNYVWANSKRLYDGAFGQLPADKDRMLAELDQVIATAETCERLTDPAEMALSGKLFGL